MAILLSSFWKRLIIAAGLLINLGVLAVFIAFIQRTGAVPVDVDPIEQIRTLPYVSGGTVIQDDSNPVVRHDAGRVQDGVNLAVFGERWRAALITNGGVVVRTWADPAPEGSWHDIELADRGLWTITRDQNLSLLDGNSRVIERHHLRFHHDLDVASTGDLYALYRTTRRVPANGRSYPALVDAVAVIRDGSIIDRLDLYGPLRAFLEPDVFARIDAEVKRMEARGETFADKELKNDTPFDLFHVNSIDVLETSIPGVCVKGDLLLSVRHLDRLVVLDPAQKRVRWSWGETELEEQHHATLLENGNILLFDNGLRRGSSRVLEVDPRDKTIVWSYPGPDDPKFFTKQRGGVQRLSNGNTLITISEEARVIEVTAGGEIVWEFIHPDRNKRTGRRRGLYRMTRYESPVGASLAE